MVQDLRPLDVWVKRSEALRGAVTADVVLNDNGRRTEEFIASWAESVSGDQEGNQDAPQAAVSV